MAAFREDVRSFTEETERTMGELEKELIALRDRADEHAGRLEQRLGTGLQEVAAAEESFRARVDDAEEKTGGRIAELGAEATGAPLGGKGAVGRTRGRGGAIALIEQLNRMG
jgi:hypothetical protein